MLLLYNDQLYFKIQFKILIELKSKNLLVVIASLFGDVQNRWSACIAISTKYSILPDHFYVICQRAVFYYSIQQIV